MSRKFTVYIEKDVESGMFIGSVPSLPGAHTYAETLDLLQERLSEVISLCLAEMPLDEIAFLPTFAGLTQIEVST